MHYIPDVLNIQNSLLFPKITLYVMDKFQEYFSNETLRYILSFRKGERNDASLDGVTYKGTTYSVRWLLQAAHERLTS